MRSIRSLNTIDDNAPNKQKGYNYSHATLESEKPNKLQNKGWNRGYRLPKNGLSQAPGYCDNSLYYLSPMDLNLLAQNEALGKGHPSTQMKGNSSFTVNQSPTPQFAGSSRTLSSQHSSRPRTPQSQLGHRLLKTQKKVERV